MKINKVLFKFKLYIKLNNKLNKHFIALFKAIIGINTIII